MFIENFLLVVLRSKHSSIEQATGVLHQIASWCDVPQNIIELFLNYDNDQTSKRNLVQNIVSTLIQKCESPAMTSKDKEQNAKLLQTEAQSCLAIVLRSIMNASATVHLIENDKHIRNLASDGWIEDDGELGIRYLIDYNL